MTRYKDFRAVFMGHSTPQQGHRVLSQICRWGGLYGAVPVYDDQGRADPYGMASRAGSQELCQRIVSTIHVEPETPPEGAQKEE